MSELAFSCFRWRLTIKSCIAGSLTCWIMLANASAQPPITAIAFSPAGDRLVAGTQDTLTIRDWPSLNTISHHDVPIGQIQDVRFSPDQTRLLIAGGNPSEFGQWRIVDWPELDLIASSQTHDDVIHSVAWQSDDQFITGSADQSVIRWRIDWQTTTDCRVEAIRRWSGHSRPVLCVEAFRDGGLVATAGADQSIRVWDTAATGSTPLRVLDNHTDIVRDLAKRPGKHALVMLASASADRTVRFWQPTIGRLVRFARLPVEPLAIAWSHAGEHVGVACTDGKLRIVHANTVQITQTLDAIDGWAYAVAASDDGSFAVAGSDGTIARVVP